MGFALQRLLLSSRDPRRRGLCRCSWLALEHLLSSCGALSLGPTGDFHLLDIKVDVNCVICMKLNMTQNGKWKNVYVMGTKQDDGTYSVEYEGQNEFKVLSVSKTHLVAHNFNVDKQGKETELTGLFVKFNVEDEDEDLEKFRTEDQGSDRKYVVTFAENVKGSDVEDEGLEKFKEFARKRGIKEENIVDIKKSDCIQYIKGPTLCTSWEEFHRDSSITEMWSTEVHQDSDIGSATSSCTLDSLLSEAHPISHHAVDSSKPLVLFYSPTERVPETRPTLVAMESRSTTQRSLSGS
ncbi:hypothetical protein AB1E18_019602 [Capra hircus]